MSMVKTGAFVLCLSATLMVGSIGGCSGGKETTVTTTTVTSPSRTVSASPHAIHSQDAVGSNQETTVTTTTTKTEKESSPGIIGSAFGLVGAVIAFPFRVVGGALDALF